MNKTKTFTNFKLKNLTSWQLKVYIKPIYKEYGQDYSVGCKPPHRCTRLIELPLAKKHIFLQNV